MKNYKTIIIIFLTTILIYQFIENDRLKRLDEQHQNSVKLHWHLLGID